jgi:hypothetical protein
MTVLDLSNEPSAPVAPAGTVRLRNNAGALQASASGSAYETITPNPQPSVLRWVDTSDGSDTTGDGSYAQPWLTIQHAYDQITDASFAKTYTVMIVGTGNVGSGAVTITGKPNINLQGPGWFNSLVIQNPLVIASSPGRRSSRPTAPP